MLAKINKVLLFTLIAGCGSHAWAAPLSCLIEPGKVAEIGSPEAGIIENIPVERSDFVKKGQVVAYLKADTERASVDVASARAQSEADLRASVAANNLAQLKKTRAQDLYDVGFISKEALQQAQIEADIAQSHVAQSAESQKISQQELKLSHSQFDQRHIVAPFSGVVTDRFRTEGERVEREPIVRIAQIDPLRVEVILPAAQFGRVAQGAPVSLKTDVPGLEHLSAKVELIDRVIDAASNTFRIRLSLPNPGNKIPAGLRCTAELDGSATASLQKK